MLHNHSSVQKAKLYKEPAVITPAGALCRFGPTTNYTMLVCSQWCSLRKVDCS